MLLDGVLGPDRRPDELGHRDAVRVGGPGGARLVRKPVETNTENKDSGPGWNASAALQKETKQKCILHLT